MDIRGDIYAWINDQLLVGAGLPLLPEAVMAVASTSAGFKTLKLHIRS